MTTLTKSNRGSMLALAISIMSQAFQDKSYNGGPYALHCLRVMFAVDQSDEELMTIAVLHDLIEDCPEWSVEDLEKAGFSRRVVNAVDILTCYPGMYYDAYIRKIATNEDARRVKMADLWDNTQITRIKGLTAKDLARIEKYYKSYTYLSKV